MRSYRVNNTLVLFHLPATALIRINVRYSHRIQRRVRIFTGIDTDGTNHGFGGLRATETTSEEASKNQYCCRRRREKHPPYDLNHL